MKKIAFFDFDGTITYKDSLYDFCFFYFKDRKIEFFYKIVKALPVLLGYKLKLINNSIAKEKIFTILFKNTSIDFFRQKATDYSLNRIDKIVRKDAKEELNKLKKLGFKIVIVSASLKCWLEPWCNKNDFELISTELEIKDKIITGKFKGNNCYGREKVLKILEKYNLEEYNDIYAYGDSEGDKYMLSLAKEKFYKKFKLK